MLSDFNIDMLSVKGMAWVLVPALIAFIYIKMIQPWLRKRRRVEESRVVTQLEGIWSEAYPYMRPGTEYILLLSSDLWLELVEEYEKRNTFKYAMTFNGLAVMEHSLLDKDTIVLMTRSDYEKYNTFK